MERIGNQFSINNIAAADAAKTYARNNDLGFAQLIGTHNAGIDGMINSLRPDVSPALTLALSGLIGAYGINVPPKLRIFSTRKNFRLEEGDERNSKFEQLLHDHSGVFDLLSQVQSQALAAREAALHTAINNFTKGSASGYDMQGLLTEFKEDQKPGTISIVYDGNSTQLEERDGKNWRPIKHESDFMADLVRAYHRYWLMQSAEHKLNNTLTPILPGQQASS